MRFLICIQLSFFLHRHQLPISYSHHISFPSQLPTGFDKESITASLPSRDHPQPKNKEKLVRQKWVDRQIRREKRKEMIRQRNYYEYWLWLWASTPPHSTHSLHYFPFTAFPLCPSGILSTETTKDSTEAVPCSKIASAHHKFRPHRGHLSANSLLTLLSYSQCIIAKCYDDNNLSLCFSRHSFWNSLWRSPHPQKWICMDIRTNELEKAEQSSVPRRLSTLYRSPVENHHLDIGSLSIFPFPSQISFMTK